MKNIKKLTMNSMLLVAFLIAAVVISCDDDNDPIVDTTLTVMQQKIDGQTLEDGIEEVNVESEIELLFSHTLNVEKTGNALILSKEGSAVDVVLEYSNTDSQINISPTEFLDYETSYSLLLPSGDYGIKGESLNNDLVINFKTAAFVPPTLSLSADLMEIVEDGQTSVVTATISKTSKDDITATLQFLGTATVTEDFVVDGEVNITIPAGSLTASISITSVIDAENEGNEEIVIKASDVSNANYDGNDLNITILEQLPAVSLKGVTALTWEGSGTNDGKAIHLIVNRDVPDLSLYSIGVANNGGGTDGIEYTLPVMSANAGDDILIAREPDLLGVYFGGCMSEFEHVLLAESSISQNGDDAIELYQGDAVIDVLGDPDVDGTDQPWEYKGSWAYKFDGEWIFGGVDCSVGSTTTQSSDCTYPICSESLVLQGVMAIVWDGSGSNGGKAVHLKAMKDIPDLSVYSIGVANNGGGTDGIEYTFPAIAVSEGDDIVIAREVATLSNYFGNCINGIEHFIETDAMNQNGDDAIELFKGENVIETYGDANVDGTGEPWEYAGSWAYKNSDGWITGGLDCAAGSTTTQNSTCIYPLCN